MRPAISSIAWNPDCNTEIANLLQSREVCGVEIAPMQFFPRPIGATDEEIEDCRRFWEAFGIRIVAMQALLFGRPEFVLFGDSSLRRQTHDYLAGLIRLSGRLGVEAMVFGSPKNRRRDSLPFEAACDVAVPFFRSLGKIAEECGTWLCIEPNPTDYGCDFITTAAEGLALVKAVDQPGFGLHLDAAGMTISNDSSDVITDAGAWLRHFHISEPHLAPLAPKTALSRHANFALALARARYPGWTSIEMKRTDSYLADITTALDYGSSYYVNREC